MATTDDTAELQFVLSIDAKRSESNVANRVHEYRFMDLALGKVVKGQKKVESTCIVYKIKLRKTSEKALTFVLEYHYNQEEESCSSVLQPSEIEDGIYELEVTQDTQPSHLIVKIPITSSLQGERDGSKIEVKMYTFVFE